MVPTPEVAYLPGTAPDERTPRAVFLCSDALDVTAPNLPVERLGQLRFTGSSSECLRVHDTTGRLTIVVGLGAEATVTVDGVRQAAQTLAAEVEDLPSLELTPCLLPHLAQDQVVAAVVEGFEFGRYRFDRYRTDARRHLTRTVHLAGAQAVVAAIEKGAKVATAVSLARDMVNTPAGDLTPADFARIATAEAGRRSVAATVRTGPELAALGFGGLIGVGRGSSSPPYFVELDHRPADPVATVALVGKGITFDAGGIDLKRPEQLEQMKCDMAGAAGVLAATLAAADLGLPLRVWCLLPLAENWPGPGALRPGDVLRIHDGSTVEVVDTDAEGRLVLADALSYATAADLDAVIDLATLTDGSTVALGPDITAVMGNEETLVTLLRETAAESGEGLWPLPLPAQYRASLRSQVADLRNVAATPHGTTVIAGLFLEHYVRDTPWLHLDIAGTAMTSTGGDAVATGAGVRTIVNTLAAIAAGRWTPPSR